MNKIIAKEQLENMYICRNMTIRQISSETGISVGCIFNRLKAFAIPTRKRGTLGKQHTQETKELLSKLLSGKKRTEKTKIHISEAKRGIYRRKSKYGGHTKKHKNGYILVYVPNHPYATKDGYVFEHILSYEISHNCIVDRNKFVIHHLNEDKTDNCPDNLILMTKSEHMKYHSKKRHSERRNKNA